MKDKKPRCFIAIDLPEELFNECAAVQTLIKAKSNFRANYVDPENLHATLKFIGDIPDKEIERIQALLNKVNHSSLDVTLTALSTFGKTRAHNVWIGINGLDNLQSSIQEILNDDYPAQHSFVGHITLARFRKPVPKDKFLFQIDGISVRSLSGSVDRFHLYKSNLTPQGPQYKKIRSYSLG